MKTDDKKYMSLLNILKSSQPRLKGKDEIEENVLRRIQKSRTKAGTDTDILDFLFGWVFVPWVRKTLITISVFFIGLFIYQQSLILRRLSILEDQTIVNGLQPAAKALTLPDDRMILNDLPLTGINKRTFLLTRRQIEKYRNSYNELENKYKDLILLIESDPELKKMLEKKLSEKSKKKFNL